MSPKAIAVAGLSAIAIAASGCSGDSDAEAEANVRSAFKKRFATAPSALLWYDRITGMDLVDGRLEIATDLEPATDDVLYNARAYAEAICQGVTNLSFEGNAEGIETTSVTGIDGVPLAQCAQVWPDADSDAEAESPPAATTTEKPPAVDIAKFRAAFKERFGTPGNEAPWYHHISGMKMDYGDYQILEIATDLAPPEGNVPDNAPGPRICRAAMGFALNSEAGDGIEGVQMLGPDGAELNGCA